MVDEARGWPAAGRPRGERLALPLGLVGTCVGKRRRTLLGVPPGGWRRPRDETWTLPAAPWGSGVGTGESQRSATLGATTGATSDPVIDRLRACLAGLARDLQALPPSREAVEATLCDRLGGSQAYDGAWFGRLDRRRGAVVSSAAAGDETRDVAIARDADDPVAEALDRAEPVLGWAGDGHEVAPIADPIADQGAGPGAGDGRVAAVPMVYDGVARGVLVLYPAGSRAVDGVERSLLGVLGGLGSMALNATEARRLVAADGVVELDFRLADPDVTCARLATALECVLELESTLDGDGDLPGLLFLARGVDPDALLAATRDRPGVAAARLLTTGDSRALLEVDRAAPSLVDDLASRGAETAAMRAESGLVRTTLRIPRGADTGPVLEALESRAAAVTLTARRERERRDRTRQELVAAVEEALTDRQRVALEKAYVGGFFDWPRDLSGKRLAASMDISPATYHEHLRAAERKVFDALFSDRWRAEEEPGPGDAAKGLADEVARGRSDDAAVSGSDDEAV